MAHLKNFRGATNYFFPRDNSYRDNYDKIFGKSKPTDATNTEETGHGQEQETKRDGDTGGGGDGGGDTGGSSNL